MIAANEIILTIFGFQVCTQHCATPDRMSKLFNTKTPERYDLLCSGRMSRSFHQRCRVLLEVDPLHVVVEC